MISDHARLSKIGNAIGITVKNGLCAQFPFVKEKIDFPAVCSKRIET